MVQIGLAERTELRVSIKALVILHGVMCPCRTASEDLFWYV